MTMEMEYPLTLTIEQGQVILLTIDNYKDRSYENGL